MRTHGLRVERSEEERNVLLRSQDSSVTACIPSACLGPVAGDAPRRSFLRPDPASAKAVLHQALSACQIAELTVRPLAKLPCHEDYCLPWGWRCLSPYWYSTPNWRDYLRLLGRSARDGLIAAATLRNGGRMNPSALLA